MGYSETQQREEYNGVLDDVNRVDFVDNNGKRHIDGYKPQTKDALKGLIKALIEQRGYEGDFNDIDVSNLDDLSYLFSSNEKFNGDISGWNTSNVTNMCGMFCGAESFNQDISGWDVSNIKDMSHMFYYTKSFNQDLSSWNISNVKDMTCVFECAESFNQDLSNWKINSETPICYMFRNCLIKNEYKPKIKNKIWKYWGL